MHIHKMGSIKTTKRKSQTNKTKKCHEWFGSRKLQVINSADTSSLILIVKLKTMLW